MPGSILALGEADLQPLLREPSSMDGAMDAIEKATVDQYRRRDHIRELNVRDETREAADPNIVRFRSAFDDAFISGIQVSAETYGAPELPNARWFALLDGKTRQLLAIVDYGCLNPVRVGACGGVAARHLAPTGALTLAMLGSRAIARTQLQAIFRAVPSLERARVYSPTPEHREAYAREMTKWLGLQVDAVATPREATEGADIVDFANNSPESIIESSWVKPGALIISNHGGQFPSEIVEQSRVVATDWGSLPAHEPFGSFIKAGRFSRADVAAELGQVILKEVEVRRHPQETVVFELTGIQLWAVRLAHWACEWARSQGVGTAFALSAE